MDQNIVVTSDSNSRNDGGRDIPASFVSSFSTPVRLGEGYKLALKGIHYGPSYNISNHFIHFELKTKSDEADDDGWETMNVKIKNQWCPSVYLLFEEIAKSLNNYLDKKDFDMKLVDLKYDPNYDSVELLFDHKKLRILRGQNQQSILDLLDLPDEVFESLSSKNCNFSTHFPAFVYVSVVENSMINQNPSRLLSIVPMTSGYTDGSQGYHHYEFSNPIFHDFEIREFSDILYEIRGPDSKLIEFKNEFPTILSLQVYRPLNLAL